MSEFQCDYCGCAENSVMTLCYHISIDALVDDPEELARYRKELGLKHDEPFGRYCSVCCPIGDKEWHGLFERIYLPKGEFETTEKGNLRHIATQDENIEKFILKIEKD